MTKRIKGFTLIELLVVIVIIGILATLATVTLSSARGKARDARRVSDVKQMMTALELYYNDAGGYPVTGTAAIMTNGVAIEYSGTTYMAKIPANALPADGSTCATPVASRYDPNIYDYIANGTVSGGTYSSYTIGYCLGSSTGSISAGYRYATPAGIQ